MRYYLGNVGGHIAIVDEMDAAIKNQITIKITSEAGNSIEIDMERYSHPKRVNKDGSGAVRELWRFKQVDFDPQKDTDIKDMEFKVVEVLKGE